MTPFSFSTNQPTLPGPNPLIVYSESYEDGPAENRTPNPLMKSSLADQTTTGHDGLRAENSDESEP